MLKGTKAVGIVAAISVLAAGTLAGTANAQKEPVSKQPDKLALGQNQVKQLLLIINTDQDHKVSKQELIEFVNAEYERLAETQGGELDVKNLAQPSSRLQTYASMGK